VSSSRVESRTRRRLNRHCARFYGSTLAPASHVCDLGFTSLVGGVLDLRPAAIARPVHAVAPHSDDALEPVPPHGVVQRVAVIEHVTRRQTPLTAGQCVTVRPWRRRGTGSGPDGARELAPSAIACPRSSDTGISTTSLAVTGAARCSFGRGTTSTAQRNACARLACNGTARGGDRRLSPRPADSWSARHWGAPAPRCAERRCVVLTRLQMPCRSRRHRPRKHSPTRSGPRPSSAAGTALPRQARFGCHSGVTEFARGRAFPVRSRSSSTARNPA
jgi:hypothetical protein